MPAFGGSNFFGTAVTCALVGAPRARQENAFPGVNGIETLDQGARGGHAVVTGLLYGPSAALLAAAESTFDGYRDGQARAFTDQYGQTYQNVLLHSFEPVGRVRQTPNGVYLREYKAVFRFLGP